MDKSAVNPFILKGYVGGEYFCDRDKESKLLINNAKNGLNSTLISIRRMGKTGLLHHTLHQLKANKAAIGIYTDMYDTENLQDFTNRIANAVLGAFPEKHPFWKKAYQFIKQLRPVISVDELTGSPQLTLDYTSPKQFESSLLAILRFLDEQEQMVLIAIDEFQQIVNYPEKNMEAVLRTQIQQLKNVHFIFSGSSPHLLSEMFNSAKRPFFSSAQTIQLQKIGREDYAGFIRYHFEKNKKNIDPEAIDFILQFSKSHTFYTQLLCNRTFQNAGRKVDLGLVQHAAHELLELNESVYFQYRRMLTANQWKLLKAIAKEDKMTQPGAAKNLQKYKLGTSSSVQRALESLLEKEMIYVESDDEGNSYSVYDCFLSRWMERS